MKYLNRFVDKNSNIFDSGNLQNLQNPDEKNINTSGKLPTKPTKLSAFVAAEAARHPQCPGLVIMSTQLVELWREAENECGCPLNLSGHWRMTKPRILTL